MHRQCPWLVGLCFLVAGFVAVAGEEAAPPPNLLQNGDFAAAGKGWSAKAADGNKITYEEKECRFNIAVAQKGSDGQVGQKVKVKTGAKYRLTGEMMSSKSGVAYFQLKMLEGKTAAKTLAPARASTEWKAHTFEFVAETNLVEVICRFKQNEGNEGVSGAFRNLSLVEIAPADPVAQAAAEAAAKASRDAALAAAAAKLRPESFISPAGSGDKSGSSRDNAADSLAKAWSATAPGGTVYAAPGVYQGQSFSLTPENGGGEGRVKRLLGVDGPEGAPTFVGNWTKEEPAKGLDFAKLQHGASYVSFENLKFRNYRDVFMGYGANVGLTFKKLDMEAIRDGMYLCAAREVLIEDCRMVHFTKRAVRFQDGTENAVVRNVYADAGGKEWATEPWQTCFSVGDGKKSEDKNILYENCTALNAYHDAGGDPSKYWNADGFCAEGATRDITWINCRAFGSTDGGWDIKTQNPKLVNCVAFDNKRNFRIWSKEPALLENCIGGYANKRGGSGTEAGLHVCQNGTAIAKNCTFVGNRIAVDADQNGVAELDNCLIVVLGDKAMAFDVEGGAKVNGRESGVITKEMPKFKNPVRDWDGLGDDFDLPKGEKAGYRSVAGK